jgi:hypothetical protein
VGVFTSEDGGATWNVPQDGPANVSVKELFWIGTTLYAATFGRGLYRIDIPNAALKTAINCYTLRIDSDNEWRGGVVTDVAPNCDGGRTYTAGTVVLLKARARGPYAFSRWSGDVTSDDQRATITMNANKTVIAHFTTNEVCFPLAIDIIPAGAGQVTTIPPSNCGNNYIAGTEVIFLGTASSGYAFGGWGGDYFGPDPVGSLEMDGPRRIDAIFAAAATNDDIANATEIRGSASFIEDTSAAGNAPDDPVVCEAGKSGKTVWFRFTPAQDSFFRVDTNGSNYHTVIQVYTGRPGALNAVACSAEALPDIVPREISETFELVTDELAGIQLSLLAGTTYYVEVGDATEPALEENDFNFTEDFKDIPDGGLLQVNVTFAAGKPRGRAARH